MAQGDILGAIAKQETSEQILDTLGNFAGGGTDETLSDKLDKIIEKQNVFDDDFYIECSKNYTDINPINSTYQDSVTTLVDIQGCGTILYLKFEIDTNTKVYIDDDVMLELQSNATSYVRYFGAIAISTDGGYISTKMCNFYGGGVSSECSSALNFKKSLKVVAQYTGKYPDTRSCRIIYGIGGAAQ